MNNLPSKLFLCIFCIIFASSAFSKSLSYRELRYTKTVGQSNWFTCGAAAVATLLKYYYQIDSTEQEVLKIAAPELEHLYTKYDPDSKISLNALQLKKALVAKGVTAKGYKLSIEELKTYFNNGGYPVLIHTTKPQLHFLVAIGITDNHIVLSDPSWGSKILPLKDLTNLYGFSGITLVTIPSTSQEKIVRTQQLLTLKESLNRSSRLGE